MSFENVSEQQQVRLEKRQRILDSGKQAYPVELKINADISSIRQEFKDITAETHTGKIVALAGRVIFIRNTGKLCFASIQNGLGDKIQLMISLAEVGDESLQDWKNLVDIGDFVYAKGEVISSKRGELSILVKSWEIASKALRPLPVTHKELNEETRIRNRHIELIISEKARKVARIRVAVIKALRNALEKRDFLEIETPMLQTLQGGAAARPFVTHSNALDIDLFLRIAPELFLKRAVVGGLERVFEINRNFRNEGIDSSHSPEFSMLETYQAYGTYEDSAKMIREIIQEISLEVFGSLKVTLDDETEYDFSGQWREMEMYPSLSEALGIQVTPDTSVAQLLELAKKNGLEIPTDKGYGHGKIVEELWEHVVGDQLFEPVFVKNFPVETSPLTRDHREYAGITEKWDLYVRGFELATGYSELVDPVIQRERFLDQAKFAAEGDDEAMALDEDFLEAMEQGMPPTTGIGMGIDRLLMAFTGLGIRDTILFPIVKPRN